MSTYERISIAIKAGLGGALGDLLWYAGAALAVWAFFYVVFRRRLESRKISRRGANSRQVAREIACSLRSIAVYGVVIAAVVYAAYGGWTRLYVPVARYGWPWFFASIAVMIVLHDAYFYWTHRLMHARWLYRAMHRTHHRSVSPTPWAAYSFSTGEALVQAGIGPLLVCTLPVHPAAFASFMAWQIAFNVLGHCGYEIYPGWFLRSPLGCVLNSVTHHSLHHEQPAGGNYGLYFNWWDRLMGTNHAQYQARFEAVTERAGEQPGAPG